MASEDVHAAAFAVGTAVSAVVMGYMACLKMAREPKYNIKTINEIDFDGMLEDPRYNAWFKENLRCSQRTFAGITTILRSYMTSYSVRRSKHSFEKKVAVFLYFLATEGGYREVAGVFGGSKSWSIDIVATFTEILVAHAGHWIRTPTTPAGWRAIARGFRRKQGIPFVVGAVDRTLVEINRPRDYNGFCNRNGDPSLNIQAVVDSDGKFLSVDVRPGSYSDKNMESLDVWTKHSLVDSEGVCHYW